MLTIIYYTRVTACFLLKEESEFLFLLYEQIKAVFFMLFLEACLCVRERVCIHSVFRDLLQRINNMRVKQSQRGLFALL